ncbi:MAG: hypothetical protein R3279_05065 [Putridiphycobacter sp.]|nr:hypothetical protein [Putridiphycobacter sp.]
MKNRQFLGLVCALTMIFGLSACNKDSLKSCVEHEKTACNEDLNKTNIRIVNASKYDFCNVSVNSGGTPSLYGIIESGINTCYHSFDLAYAIADISLVIGDKKFTITPESYIGEQPLGNGKFTYTIDVLNFNSGLLSLKTSKN